LDLNVGVKCFFVTPSDHARRTLRRYSSYKTETLTRCPGRYGFHNADVLLEVIPRGKNANGDWAVATEANISHDDPRWPAKCDGCEYHFAKDDEWQINVTQVYADAATGREYMLRDAEQNPGMMWDADWFGESMRGPDGRCLVVVCPNGHQWMIDTRCSNCTLPKDSGPFGTAHRCWTRTGEPPLISVGKQYGKTCSAGGGSIQAGDYHGFLGSNGAAPGYFT
jgi:hypothetical protein